MAQVAARRLLAVDDSHDSAELVARIASRCGYDAQSASEPDKVHKLLREWRPEVLTLDLCMPGADGIDVLSVLTETGFKGEVIIISGQDEWLRKAAARLAAARGVTVADEMEKPVKLDALRHILGRLQKPDRPEALE